MTDFPRYLVNQLGSALEKSLDDAQYGSSVDYYAGYEAAVEEAKKQLAIAIETWNTLEGEK
jgi:hypothetical protein